MIFSQYLVDDLVGYRNCINHCHSFVVTALSRPTVVQLLLIRCTRIDYNFYHCIICMTLYLCTFVLSSRNKAARGRTAGVQGRVSRWNELRSSTKGLSLPHRSIDHLVERPLGRKDLYSRCMSAGPCAWVIYGSHMRRHYIMTPPYSEHYKYPSSQGLRIHSRSGVHRIGISQE